jgi:hypothetical protein
MLFTYNYFGNTGNKYLAMTSLPAYDETQLKFVNDLDTNKAHEDLFDYGFNCGDIHKIALPNGQEILWAAKAAPDMPDKIARLGIAFIDTEGELIAAHFDALTGSLVIGEMKENLTKSGRFAKIMDTFNSEADNPLNVLNAERKFFETRVMLEAAAETLALSADVRSQVKPELKRLDDMLEEQLGVEDRPLVSAAPTPTILPK